MGLWLGPVSGDRVVIYSYNMYTNKMGWIHVIYLYIQLTN